MGLLAAKNRLLGGFPLRVYLHLYNSLVVPVMDYSAGIWGYKYFPKLGTIQNNAMRYFLGLGKNCPITAVEGDMGWLPVQFRHQLVVFELWQRLCTVENSRMVKLVFGWSCKTC